MRTRGAEVGEGRRLGGDPALAEALARALSASGPFDRATHGFHTWPAGLHPDAARDLMRLFPDGSVVDPFCGGGTVLVEAMLAGRRALGRDLSSFAVRVARARTCTASEDVLTAMRSRARRLADEAKDNREAPPPDKLAALKEWYAPHVLAELEGLRRGIAREEGEVRLLLEVVFSSILVKTSWRESDTSPRRVRHDRPRGTTAHLFHKKARELGRRIGALREAVPAGTPPADVAQGDARALNVRGAGLVLTSPPYPSTYDYLPLQHLRRIWFGHDEPDDLEIGARRQWREGERGALVRWKADTAAWVAAAARALRPGGALVIVVGDGHAPGGDIDARGPTVSAVAAAGLSPVAEASVERLDHARGGARWEHVLAFRAVPRGGP